MHGKRVRSELMIHGYQSANVNLLARVNAAHLQAGIEELRNLLLKQCGVTENKRKIEQDQMSSSIF